MVKIDNIIDAVSRGKIIWRHHSKIRMGQRQITGKEVKEAIFNGEIIENYENDKPFPSCLIFGLSDERPIHTVIGYNEIEKIVFIISVYEPDLNQFEGNFKRRRKKNG